MQKNLKVVMLVSMLMFLQSTFAQDKPEELVEKFFVNYQKIGASGAIDSLYATNDWVNRKTDEISSLKNQIEGLTEDYVGQYYGYELIVEKKVANSYLLVSYLVKFDRQPIRFTFQFYKPNNEWKIFAFQYDGNLDDEIEEAAKLYYQKLK